MLNGREKTSKNNFTYVSNLRKSVIDYMIVPYNELARYKNIEIKLISDIILQKNTAYSQHKYSGPLSFDVLCSMIKLR